jgi:hypothetical protein
MQGRKIDMIGRRFDRLIVVSDAPSDARQQAMWKCRCDCGQETITRGSDLRFGKSKSCGCLTLEINKARMTSHGKTRTPEHNIWLVMRDRCRNPKNKRFNDYGGRGIQVCERWDDFSLFLADLGPRPTSNHSIDRINNDGNYEPGNVKWSTPIEQRHNQRRTQADAVSA